MQIPIEALQWLRGVFGDPAITTALWLALWLANKASVGRLALPGPRLQVLATFGLLAVLLYPMALGVGAWDPYRNGYSPTWLLGVVAVLGLWSWWHRNWLVLLLLASATLAYGLGIKESSNYWDYLLDPFIALYCWGALLARGWRTLRSGRSHAALGQDRLGA